MEPKVCKIHGLLSESQYSIDLKPNGKTTRRCKLCKIHGRKSYLKRLMEKNECSIHGKLIPDLIKSDGRCKLCHRKNANRKRNENRAWFNAKMKIAREKNPDKWKGIYRTAYLKFREKHKDQYSLKKCCDSVGITLKYHQKVHEKQNGACAICFQPESRLDPRTKSPYRLTIDHCHKTKKFRGLLCHSCNTALGKFSDDIPRIIRAARYVKEGGFISQLT